MTRVVSRWNRWRHHVVTTTCMRCYSVRVRPYHKLRKLILSSSWHGSSVLWIQFSLGKRRWIALIENRLWCRLASGCARVAEIARENVQPWTPLESCLGKPPVLHGRRNRSGRPRYSTPLTLESGGYAYPSYPPKITPMHASQANRLASNHTQAFCLRCARCVRLARKPRLTQNSLKDTNNCTCWQRISRTGRTLWCYRKARWRGTRPIMSHSRAGDNVTLMRGRSGEWEVVTC